MMSPRLRCRLTLALLGGGLLMASGGCATAPAIPELQMPPPPAVSAASGLGPVTVAELVDLRPSSLLDTRGPHVESSYYVLMMGSGFLYIDGARVEGATLHGAPEAMPAPAVDGLVAALTGARDRVKLSSAALADGDPTRALESLGVRDGRAIIPILDQMDAVSLSSKTSIVGGSSSEVGRSSTTVTMRTTSGAATMSAATPTWFNVRVRLLVGELRDGRVRSLRWVYGRGHGADADETWRTLIEGLRDGLSPPPPPEPPPVEDVEPPPASPEESPVDPTQGDES